MTAPEKPVSNLSSAQANFVYWLNGLAPVATNIVTPLVVYWTMRCKPDATNLQRYNQQVNEVVRQFVSGTIGLVSYFGGGELTRGLLKGLAGPANSAKSQMDDSTRQVAMIMGGVAMSFIGFAFVRPKISTDLIYTLLKKADNSSNLISHDKLRNLIAELPETGQSQFSKAKLSQEVGKLQKKCYVSVSQAMEMATAASGDETGKLDLIDKSKYLAALDTLEGKSQAGQKSARATGFMAGIREKAKASLELIGQRAGNYLVPKGEPSAGRTATVATLFLSVYLGSLTAILWGVNRFLGKDAEPAPKAITPPLQPQAPQVERYDSLGLPGYSNFPYAAKPKSGLYPAYRPGFPGNPVNFIAFGSR